MTTEIKRTREVLSVTEVSKVTITEIVDSVAFPGGKARSIRVFGSASTSVPALEIVLEGATADKILITVPETEF